MARRYIKHWLGLIVWLVLSQQGVAQVVPNGLGTQVERNGRTIDIRGGSRAGNNLFHSFSLFNVQGGEIANFWSQADIRNILARVTGGSISYINGLIQVLGGQSNLFLMNPAGFIFGPNASLNVPAAFIATTARQVNFPGGTFDMHTTDVQRLVGNPVGLGDFGSGRMELNEAILKAQGQLALLGGQGGVRLQDAKLYSDAGITITAKANGLVEIRHKDYLLGFEVRPEQLLQAKTLADVFAKGSQLSAPTVQLAGEQVSLHGTRIQGQQVAARGTQSLVVDKQSSIVTGGSGQVTLIAKNTGFAGQIINPGGFVEVSGTEQLRFTGRVQAETLLIDPANLWVIEDIYVTPGGVSVLTVDALIGQLQSGNVILSATNEIKFPFAPNPIDLGTVPAGRSLTLKDATTITVERGVVNANFLNLTIDAGNQANVRLVDAHSLNLGGGNLTINAPNVFLQFASLGQIETGNNNVSVGFNNSVAGLGNRVYGTNNTVDGSSNNNRIIGSNNALTVSSSGNIVLGNQNTFNNSGGNTVGGDSNTLGSANNNSVYGNTNNLSGANSNFVQGSSNILTGASNNNVVGYSNTLVSSNLNTVTGIGNTFNVSNQNTLQGDANSLTNSNNNTLIGNNNQVTLSAGSNITGNSNTIDTVSFLTVVGERNNIQNDNGSVVVGINNVLNNTSSSNVYGVDNQATGSGSVLRGVRLDVSGNSNQVEGVSLIVTGNNNQLAGSVNVRVHGNDNRTTNAGNFELIGNNNEYRNIVFPVFQTDIVDNFTGTGPSLPNYVLGPWVVTGVGNVGIGSGTVNGDNNRFFGLGLTISSNNSYVYSGNLPLTITENDTYASDGGRFSGPNAGNVRFGVWEISSGTPSGLVTPPSGLPPILSVPTGSFASSGVIYDQGTPSLSSLPVRGSGGSSQNGGTTSSNQLPPPRDFELNRRPLPLLEVKAPLTDFQKLASVDAQFAQEFLLDGLEPQNNLSLSQMQDVLEEAARRGRGRGALLYWWFEQEQLRIGLVLPKGPGKRAHVKETGVTRERVQAVVKQFHDFIQQVRHRDSQRYREPGRQLYEWLVGPFAEILNQERIDVLLIVPDRGLRSLAYRALWDGQRHLVEMYRLAQIPSVQLVDVSLDASASQWWVMGASDFAGRHPRLPGVEAELDGIVKLLNARERRNQAFTYPAFVQVWRQRSGVISLHLATHAQFSSVERWLAFYERTVPFEEIQQQLRGQGLTELTVLSACRTALGDARAELGFAGLAIRLGTKRVIASLWSVPDEPTVVLMLTFYQRLRQDPIAAAAEQWRQAQIIMSQSHPPYVWAGFNFVGNPW